MYPPLRTRTRLRSLSPAALALAFLLPHPLAGQTLVPDEWEFTFRSGFGWAGALPDAMLGVGGFHMFGASKWGVLGSVMIPHDSDKRSPDYQDDLTIAGILQDFPEEKRIEVPPAREEWRLLNLAAVRAITPESAFFLGAGFAQKAVVREFGDSSEDPLTRSGFYYVQDEDLTGWHPNFVGGILLRGGSRIAFLAGFESAPAILSLGAFYVFR
jgi:hypothetical protein